MLSRSRMEADDAWSFTCVNSFTPGKCHGFLNSACLPLVTPTRKDAGFQVSAYDSLRSTSRNGVPEDKGGTTVR